MRVTLKAEKNLSNLNSLKTKKKHEDRQDEVKDKKKHEYKNLEKFKNIVSRFNVPMPNLF